MHPTRNAASLAVLTSAALLAPATAALASDASLDGTERWMLGQVNAARAVAGAAPLEASLALGRAADGYAGYLAAHPGATGHEADGRTVGQRLDAAGWPGRDGYAEDVFTSRTEGAQDALDAWMASPAHRANILDGTLRSIGVARSGRSWVLDFGRACPTGADARCELTGDRGDASLPVGGSSSSTTGTAGATAPTPTGGSASTSTTDAAAPAASPTATGTSVAAASGTAAVPLRVSAVRTRGQVISVTVAVVKARRRAVRVTASRAGRTVALRLATTRSLSGGRVARTYARKLPTGTWKIHAQLRRAAVA